MTNALIALSVALPIIGMYAFYKGYKLGQMKIPQEQTEKNSKKLFKGSSKPVEDTKEVKQYKTLMDNIENYNGTAKNQQKVR